MICKINLPTVLTLQAAIHAGMFKLANSFLKRSFNSTLTSSHGCWNRKTLSFLWLDIVGSNWTGHLQSMCIMHRRRRLKKVLGLRFWQKLMEFRIQNSWFSRVKVIFQRARLFSCVVQHQRYEMWRENVGSISKTLKRKLQILFER